MPCQKVEMRFKRQNSKVLTAVYKCTILLQPGADGESHIRVGKLNMVDLAGSERQAKTGATVSTAYTCNCVIIIN